jgi:hypothetical protein
MNKINKFPNGKNICGGEMMVVGYIHFNCHTSLASSLGNEIYISDF